MVRDAINEYVGWCRVTANQNAYFQGINLASSTAATAIINLIPAFTFVFAAILGMEKVNIRSLRSGAKIFGTVICVGGAMAMAFTKGPKLLNSFQFLGSETDDDDNNWLMGCLILFASSVLWSLWIILQVPIAATCPDLIYSSAWLCSLATIQSTMVTLFIERKDFSAWKLNSFFELGCCLYSGVSLALTFLGQAWCVGERGPVFPAIFDPLCTVITAIFATIFLHEQTYMGGLIGAVVVIMGLYLVLWGKAEDMKEKGLVTDVEEPFLCNKPILV
ncbi:WAT1-related protein At4g28040 [Linum grandiflorum]